MRGHGWPLAAALLAALLIAPAAAHAVPVTTVAILNESVGPGGAQVYHPGNALITAGHKDSQSVSVGITQGSDRRVIVFYAPPGETLQPGTYADATEGSQAAGRPALFDDGPFCSYASEFEIRDLATAPDGTVQRLWAIYELQCFDIQRHTFGEVRINEPAPPGNVLALPTLVRWPDQPAGSVTQDVPITVLATAPVTSLDGAVLAGRDAASFSMGRDDCAGRTLPAGGACQVWVRASPRTPGPKSAAIEVAGGPEIGLQAFGRGGRTQLTLQSDPGDTLGMGRSGTLTPATAAFRPRAAYGGRNAGIEITRGDGTKWTAGMSVPTGQKLATGHYDDPPDDRDAPRFGISTSDATCRGPLDGSYDITSLTLDLDGLARAWGVNFVEHCQGATGSLRGTIEYEAGDTTPVAPWMRRGPVVPFPDTSAAACGGAAHLVRGGRRNDRLVGTAGRDHLVGGAGSDRLLGHGGDDCLDGGPGPDVLLCGRGEDIAFVGRGDRVKGCERVIRRS